MRSIIFPGAVSSLMSLSKMLHVDSYYVIPWTTKKEGRKMVESLYISTISIFAEGDGTMVEVRVLGIAPWKTFDTFRLLPTHDSFA